MSANATTLAVVTETADPQQRMAAHALDYAARGWHVFPAPPGERKSYKSEKYSDGRKWGATTEPEQIEHDFRRWPDANIGIVTGPKSDIWVVDVDTKDGHNVDGIASLRELEEEYGPLPETLMAISPSGSLHYYFNYPTSATIKNSESEVADGIDVRADGGMVIAPPSERPGEGKYKWLNAKAIVDAPGWLTELAGKDRPATAPTDAGDAGPSEWNKLVGNIIEGRVLHKSIRNLAAKLTASGLGNGTAVNFLSALVQQSKAWGTPRCQARYDDIPRAVSTAQEAFGKVAAPSTPLKIVSAATLAGKPAPSRVWHVPGLIPAHTVTNFSGDGGVGKSLAALQLAASTALNREWLGHSVRGGAALYMSAEDDMDELHRRLAHIADAYGVTLAELGSLHLLPYAGFDAVLASLAGRANQLEPTPLWHQVKQAVGDLKPTLVVFDTLSDVFAGDEIKRVQARQFVGMLRGLAIEHDLTSMLLSHPSLTGMSSGSGSSGSTGWNNAFRSRYYLERIFMEGQGQIEADPDLRKFTNKKFNYGPRGYEMTLRWHDGVFVRETGTESNSGQGALRVILEAEDAFLDLVGRYGAEGRAVSATPGPNYAPTMFARDPRGKGTTKRAFTTAMNRLFQAGKIATEQFGPPSKRRTRLVLVTGAN
jgi:RecA-family ATPase